jgi:hypothetical protein
MRTKSQFENRIISGLSRARTKGIVPLSLTALLLITSCSSDDPTSALDTTSSIPVSTPAPSTSSSTTTSTSSIPTTVAPIVDGSEIRSPGTGFTSLFAGHSFFDLVATRFWEQATRAGFLGHTQELVMAGGGGGAPEGLWNDPAKRSEIITHLSRGDVELFGMTYHPDYPTLTGYRLWVQEALSHNPQTAFFVGMPWVRQPDSMTASDYALTSSRAYETLMTPIIDQLKTEFPGSTFFAIPYGQAASELYEVFEAGQLPGIRNVVGDSATSLFIDTLGHASGTIVEELAVLVWLRAIYCVDLAGHSYSSKFAVDLAAIAMTIVAEQRTEDAAPWCQAR